MLGAHPHAYLWYYKVSCTQARVLERLQQSRVELQNRNTPRGAHEHAGVRSMVRWEVPRAPRRF